MRDPILIGLGFSVRVQVVQAAAARCLEASGAARAVEDLIFRKSGNRVPMGSVRTTVDDINKLHYLKDSRLGELWSIPYYG